MPHRWGGDLYFKCEHVHKHKLKKHLLKTDLPVLHILISEDIEAYMYDVGVYGITTWTIGNEEKHKIERPRTGIGMIRNLKILNDPQRLAQSGDWLRINEI